MSRRPRVAYVSLGCRVNRVETDVIIGELRRAGCDVVDEREADAVVINTCAVTGEAEAKTRKAVRRAAGLPHKPVVVATGCVANLFASELTDLGDNVVIELEKDGVAQRVLDELEASGIVTSGDVRSWAHFGTPTATGRTRPGVKVQDGCDLRCTYCIVWKARGRSRSISVDEAVRRVEEACEEGAREVVLTGINIGRYRSEHQGRTICLPGLLDALLERTDVERLRIASIEPQDVDENLARVMAQSEGRVAPFLHMCLQSGSDGVLKRMGRVYDTRLFAERVDVMRNHIPLMSFGTDFIVGFPGESDEEFAESLAFCRAMRFSKMHVFKYSKRPGTPAAVMDGQVNPIVMGMRAAKARKLSDDLRLAEAKRLVGERDVVVVQDLGRAITGGLFDCSIPQGATVGTLVSVRFDGVLPDATLVASLV